MESVTKHKCSNNVKARCVWAVVCHRRFCETCANEVERQGRGCPICRKDGQQDYPNSRSYCVAVRSAKNAETQAYLIHTEPSYNLVTWLKTLVCKKNTGVMCDCISNVVYAMSPQTVTNRLQRVMNAAARVVSLSDTRKFDRGLKAILHDELHWLDVPESSVWWCTGVCTDRHLATLLITSSQLLMLLLATAVYDVPTVTVSLCLAVD